MISYSYVCEPSPDKAYKKIAPTIKAEGKSLYLKGIQAGSGLQRPPILANPRKKWHDHSCTPTKNQKGYET